MRPRILMREYVHRSVGRFVVRQVCNAKRNVCNVSNAKHDSEGFFLSMGHLLCCGEWHSREAMLLIRISVSITVYHNRIREKYMFVGVFI